MKEEYTYRRGTLQDLEQLRKLGLASYGEYKSVLPEDGWKKMEANCGDVNTYLKLLKIAHCFICETEKEIVGMAFLIPSGNPFAFFSGDWSYIRLIGVAPQHTGKSIGKTLTKMCVDFARESGEKIVALHTSEFQDAARHIYESAGFKVLRELDSMYGKKYWLYTLNLKENTTITYYRATLEDLDVLIELRIQFTTLLTGINSPTLVKELKETMRGYFKEVLGKGTGIWVIARNGSEAVGTGGILIRQNPPNFKNPSGIMGYLVNMYTVPAFRRKGICSKIINVLIEESQKININAFELHATKEGEFVYTQQGFELHNEPTYRKYI